MFDDIVNNILKESTLKDLIKDKLRVDSKVAKKIMMQLDFSDYTELRDALNADDLELAKKIIKNENLTEVNAYSVNNGSGNTGKDANVGPSGNQAGLDINTLGVGDKIDTNKGQTTIKNASKMGNQMIYNMDNGEQLTVSDKANIPQMQTTDKDSAMQQIRDLQRMAGINVDELQDELGEALGGAVSCAAMGNNKGGIEGVNITPKQMKKKLRTRKEMKPGPKTND